MTVSANDLIVFANIVSAGSFSRAAQHMDLPKSTLSRRLTMLENTLGERLLTRSTRRLSLTDFGERILEHANRLRDETEAATALALHRQITPQGTLRVSLPPEFHELSLVPFISQFSSQYPDVRLELDLSARRVDMIAERFDIAVRIASQLLDDSSLVAHKAAILHNGLYASRRYLSLHGTPEKPADLLRHTGLALVTSNGEPQAWRLSRGHERWEGLPHNSLLSNSMGLQQALSAEGRGIVGLSARFAQVLVDAGTIERILPDWHLPAATVWCMTPGRRLLPERTRAFIALFKSVLAED